MEHHPIPVACTLEPSAVPDRMGAWHALRAHLRSSRLGDGRFEAVFTEEAAPELARLAEAERACCAWASWSVDGTRLVVTGPADGVAALADALLGASARG